jgi:hypothetical protein
MPGTFLAAWMVDTKLGRCWTTGINYFLAGVLSFIYIFDFSYIEILCLSSFSWLVMYIGYSGQFTITPESYPANIRNFG